MSEHLCGVHVFLLRWQSVTACSSEARSPPYLSKKLLLSLLHSQHQCLHRPPRLTLTVFSTPTGFLPPTVLGHVRSPDPDDWSEKVYRFEGKASR